MTTEAQSPAALAGAQAPQTWQLPGGERATVRHFRHDDAAAEERFFNGLSLDSRHQRFHIGLHRLSPALLKLLTEVDQHLHRAWVVELPLAEGSVVIADARFMRDPARPAVAEFAIAVADDLQGRGLGRRLLAHLITDARRQGVHTLFGDVLAENRRMLALAREFGMRLRAHPDAPQLVRAVHAL
ncbi:GNAT family N-acetyltransferase [Roseateles sp. BYS87W]|uniref:GNAT family N-acetyltransferase n=1 Tax=Pelomonas baiyunensis TaxID=3299026 RepID=A0ABW7GXS7_9BURK